MGQIMTDSEYEYLRTVMVEKQIRAREITNQQLLDAFLKVRRHLFVPNKLRYRAYSDYPLPIDYDQTISQPYIVAYMINLLQPTKTSSVLEIGSGSGYQTAILSHLCKEVYAVEINKSLVQQSIEVLKTEACSNIRIKVADGFKGWKDFAPFDRIIVSCAPTHLPQTLTSQLAEGGKMVIPIGKPQNQRLYIVEKNNGKISQKALLPVRFVPMIE